MGTHLSFIENCKTSQYIPRNLAAVGRHFKFSIDVDLDDVPTINCINISALYAYLCDVSNDSQFATSVLQFLIEERRTAYCSCLNVDCATKLSYVPHIVAPVFPYTFQLYPSCLTSNACKMRGFCP